jgi:hypothetical protein
LGSVSCFAEEPETLKAPRFQTEQLDRMIRIYPLLVLIALLVTAFFLWARRRTGQKQTGLQRGDVRKALEEVISESSFSRDNWELFVKWPIDDPYLESVRQRCRRILADHPRTKVTAYVSKEGVDKLRKVLEELDGRPNELDGPKVHATR